jgi:lipoyl(octanoyl) transferase
MTEFIKVAFNPDFLDYREWMKIREKKHSSVAEGTEPNQVLLFEFSEVYTAGREVGVKGLPTDGSRVIRDSRPGHVGWHGPGQLMISPVIKFTDSGNGSAYGTWMEQIIIDTVAEFGIEGIRIAGKAGVWVETPTGFSKIGYLGDGIANGVTEYGCVINCNNSLAPYDYIVTCGNIGAKSTSIFELTGQDISPEELASLVIEKINSNPLAA